MASTRSDSCKNTGELINGTVNKRGEETKKIWDDKLDLSRPVRPVPVSAPCFCPVPVLSRPFCPVLSVPFCPFCPVRSVVRDRSSGIVNLCPPRRPTSMKHPGYARVFSNSKYSMGIAISKVPVRTTAACVERVQVASVFANSGCCGCCWF